MYLKLLILILLIPLSSATTSTINQNGSYTVVNTTVSSNSIVSDVLNVTNYMGLVVGSYVDGYSCSASYCIYHPWYNPSLTNAKNGSTGRIDFSGTDSNTIVSNVITNSNNNDEILFLGNLNLTGNEIVINKKLHLKGTGYKTQIYQGNNNNLFNFTNSASGSIIEYMFLGSNATSSPGALISLWNSHRNTIRNVKMIGGYNGIYCHGCIINTFENLETATYTNDFFVAISSHFNQFWWYGDYFNDIAPNANRITNFMLEGGVNGIYLNANGEGGITVSDGTIEALNGDAIQIIGSLIPSKISNIHGEGNVGTDIIISGSANIDISSLAADSVDISGNQITIRESSIDKIIIESISQGVTIENSRYSQTGNGYIYDYALDTKIVNIKNSANSNFGYGMNPSSSWGNIISDQGTFEYNSINPFELIGDNPPTTSINTTIVHTGQKSIKVVGATSGGEYLNYNGIAYTLPSYVAGQNISIDFWLYNSGDLDHPAKLGFYNNDGNKASIFTISKTNNTWEHIQFNSKYYVLGDNNAKVVFSAPNGAKILFDDINILVTNPELKLINIPISVPSLPINGSIFVNQTTHTLNLYDNGKWYYANGSLV